MKRIALLGWYNTDAKDALKAELKLPAIAWTTSDKIPDFPDPNVHGAWTIQNKPDVVSKVVEILQRFDIDFADQVDSMPIQSEQPPTTAIKRPNRRLTHDTKPSSTLIHLS